MTNTFKALSPDHLIPVGIWAVVTVALTLMARRQSAEAKDRSAKVLAVVLVGYYLVESVARILFTDLTFMATLPFEMCNALFFIGAWGLWTRNRVALDVLWFWTMAGTIHAYLTPTPLAGYPHLHYFSYFAAHGLLLFTAIYATVGLGLVPGRGGILRAFGALLAFMVLVAVVDLVTGRNYTYLREKPPSPTLMDALGPWPLYLLGGLGVGLVSFSVWAIPWLVRERLRSKGTVADGKRVIHDLPPGPRSPGFWQLLRFAVRPYDFFDACAAKYGDIFTVDMATFGVFVHVASPELVKQVFTADTEVMHAGKANRDLAPVIGQRSVLLFDGKEHVRQRKLMMPPFHGERMRAYAQIMANGASEALAKMPVGPPFSLHPFMQSLGLDIILRAVLGFADGPAKDRMGATLVRYLEPPSPLLFYGPKVDLPFSPYRAFLKLRADLDGLIYARIAERRASTDGTHEDILSLLLATRDEDGKPISDVELRDQIVTLLITGHETTAIQVCWCFERLLSHPDALARLLTELGPEGSPDADAQLEYLDAVVKETMRMRPIIPSVVRELQAPFQLGEWLLPKGTRISPCIHLAHHREGTWPEPRAFKPERFLGTKVDPYAWFPFGGGARRCIGMAFAMYEMKIVLATVLRGARFQLAAGRPLRTVRRGVALGPEGGTTVILTERRERPAA